ncbi:MAG: hypothetical protein H6525_07485 [Actinobacteria bacterium]|nr:hypothetical protein [Actinomycetota bacterium]MCB9412671.1 hypothetical protein [Actinomycetota bacterium]
MAGTDGRQSWLTHKMLVAATAAVAAGVLFLTVFDWGLLPAVLGGFSIGVIWWSVDRAMNRPS